MKRFAVAIMILATATAAVACFWDDDTLAEEAANKMDLVHIFTGRFIRNPPLYYQMRLDRVSKELAKDPSNLDNYDNAAVASDRLGNDEAAIKWIDKKRSYMLAHKLTPITNKDDWYRYYANAGTLHAHLWFRHGAKKSEIKEIELGRDLIAKALVINPESHFGRERVQLEVLKWAIASRSADAVKEPVSLGDFLQKSEADSTADKDAKGLAGLVMLGNAWESVDIFAALEDRLSSREDGSLAQLARLRAQELMKKGVKSLVNIDPEELLRYSRYQPQGSVEPFNEGEYRRLRNEADAWQSNRTDFMLTRLKQGKHPDTDPEFWTGYVEATAPEVKGQPFWSTPKFGNVMLVAALIGVLILLVAIPILLIKWILRRVRARARAVKD